MKSLLSQYFYLADVVLTEDANQLGKVADIRRILSKKFNLNLVRPARRRVTSKQMKEVVAFCRNLANNPIELNKVIKNG